MEYRLIESSSQFSNEPPFPSQITRSKQTNRVLVSLSLLPALASILPHYFGAGNYCRFAIDFSMEYFLGNGILPVFPIEIYQLTSSQPKSIINYMS